MGSNGIETRAIGLPFVVSSTVNPESSLIEKPPSSLVVYQAPPHDTVSPPLQQGQDERLPVVINHPKDETKSHSRLPLVMGLMTIALTTTACASPSESPHVANAAASSWKTPIAAEYFPVTPPPTKFARAVPTPTESARKAIFSNPATIPEIKTPLPQLEMITELLQIAGPDRVSTIHQTVKEYCLLYPCPERKVRISHKDLNSPEDLKNNRAYVLESSPRPGELIIDSDTLRLSPEILKDVIRHALSHALASEKSKSDRPVSIGNGQKIIPVSGLIFELYLGGGKRVRFNFGEEMVAETLARGLGDYESYTTNYNHLGLLGEMIASTETGGIETGRQKMFKFLSNGDLEGFFRMVLNKPDDPLSENDYRLVIDLLKGAYLDDEKGFQERMKNFDKYRYDHKDYPVKPYSYDDFMKMRYTALCETVIGGTYLSCDGASPEAIKDQLTLYFQDKLTTLKNKITRLEAKIRTGKRSHERERTKTKYELEETQNLLTSLGSIKAYLLSKGFHSYSPLPV